MAPRPLLLLFAVLAGLSMDSAAAPRVGELAIRIGNGGIPCFTIPQDEEERAGAPDFHSITVSDGKTTLWSMAMPRQRTFPVSFRMCIPYAGRLPVLPQTPAAELQMGRAYDVYVATRKPGSAPQGYRARFCLLRQGSGAVRVRTLTARSGC